MVGKDCVAIAADRRLGMQAQTVSTDFKKIYEMNDKLFVGFYGLATDAQTVYVGITLQLVGRLLNIYVCCTLMYM